MLHVAAKNGTLINTYTVAKRELVKQVGRGKQPASVNSVSSDGVYLAACSDRGTTHIFNIEGSVATSQRMDSSAASGVSQPSEELKNSQPGNNNSMIKNTFSKLYYLSSFVPYYGHEFSFAQLRVSDTDQSSKQIVHVAGDKVILITDRGNWFNCPISGLETKLVAPVKLAMWSKKPVERAKWLT